MNFPQPVPEVPVQSIDIAVDYYVNGFGFTLDWKDEQDGIAGISRGSCRLFLTDTTFRASTKNVAPIVLWINLESKAEVDEQFTIWQRAQAIVVSEPEDKPWNLREFTVSDPDGNVLRVFYDFTSDLA